jgi:gliding motility-associated-like protein
MFSNRFYSGILMMLTLTGTSLFGQTVKINNLQAFSENKRINSNELSSVTSAFQQRHPEYAVLPADAPCRNCYELLDRRTENSRYFVEMKSKGDQEFIIQQSYGALHYLNESGYWVSIDKRLRKAGQKQFRVNDPLVPVEINVSENNCLMINQGKRLVFNNSLELLLEGNDNQFTSLGYANWNDFSAGDDGVLIRNCWPGIDMEMLVYRGAIKTNFLIAKPLQGSIKNLVIRDRPSFDGFIDGDGFRYASTDPVRLRGNDGTELGTIGALAVYDQVQEGGMEFPYRIHDGLIEMIIPGTWLSNPSRVYPVIIDPLVTASNTTLRASILGSKYSATCWVDYCSYDMDVPVPANCTVTDARFSLSYRATSPCVLPNGAMRFTLRTCLSPNQGTSDNFWWTCSNLQQPGTCQGQDYTFWDDVKTCFNAPQCAPYTVPVQLRFSRCNTDTRSGCSAECISAETDWKIEIRGRTIELSSNVPSPLPPVNQNICQGDSARIGIAGVFGVPPYTYSWAPGNQTDSVIFVKPATTQSYTLTITDQCGQQVTKQFNVNVTQGVNPDFTIQPFPACTGTPITITGLGSGPASAYDWLIPGSSTGNVNNTQVVNTQYGSGGSFDITLNYTVSGCVFPLKKTIEVSTTGQLPSIAIQSIPAMPVCDGDTLQLQAITTNAGANPVYSWFVNGSPAGTNAPIFQGNNLQNGDQIKVRIFIGSSPCISTDTAVSAVFIIKRSPPIKPVILGQNYTCFNDSTLLSSQDIYASYVWSDGDLTKDNYVTGPASIQLTVTDTNGCTGVSDVFQVEKSAPQAEVSGLTIFCENQSLTLVASPGFSSYSWTLNGAIAGDNDTLIYPGGELSLLVTDATGCKDTVFINALPVPNPTADFDYSPTAPLNTNTLIQFTDQSVAPAVDNIIQWNWSFDPPGENSSDKSPDYSFGTGGQKTVTLIVTTARGCRDTFNVSLKIISGQPIVPNAFSPNGDNINEKFEVQYLTEYPDNRVFIYNRWGKKLFEADNYQNDWDFGNIPAGTYFYVIQAPDLENELKGTFVIVRN